MALNLLVLVISSAVLGLANDWKECPPWFKWVNGTTSDSSAYCACAAESPQIKCDQQNQRSFLTPASCIYYDSKRDTILVLECPFLFSKSVTKNNLFSLPRNVSELNQVVCGNLSRELKGPFCGRCINGTGPSVYSVGIQCVPCSSVNILYYLLLQYLPITLQFIAVLALKLNLTAAPMFHYVLFCQLIVVYIRYFTILYSGISGISNVYISSLVFTLSAVWSFDSLLFISPPLCISRHMEEIYLLFLDFLAVLYPFILLLLIYIAMRLHFLNFSPAVYLCKLLKKFPVKFGRAWNPGSTLIQAFSSLLLLAYTKFTVIMWAPFILHDKADAEGGSRGPVVYLDPNVPFLSVKHILLISFSVFVALFFYFPPIFLLVIYPTTLYRKLSRRISPQSAIRIMIYVDTFQGGLKDGTSGTRDYRSVAGYLLALLGFLIPLLNCMMSAVFPYPVLGSNISTISFGVTSILFLLAQPYKHRNANASVVTLFIIGTIFSAFYTRLGYSFLLGDDGPEVMLLILLLVPHCGLACYTLWRMKTFFANCYHKYQVSKRDRLLHRPIDTDKESVDVTGVQGINVVCH